MNEGICIALSDISKLGSIWYRTGTLNGNNNIIFIKDTRYVWRFSSELNKYIVKKEKVNFTMLPEEFDSLFMNISKNRDVLIDSIINE